MDIPVVIEPVEDAGYRATGLGLSVEGVSSEDALERLREEIEARISHGVKIVALSVPRTDNPWLAFAGGLRDHPLLEQWEQAMAEYRREIDSQSDEP